ncbi:MAG: S8 family serine peptidase [Robiginitomaculum sp.]|nr:S8 family serine peptidase [Robiginitomaculum sp.]
MHHSFKIRTVLMASMASLLAACASGPPEVIDLTDGFAKKPELERLRFFKETNAITANKQLGLTGEGVRVVIMGEQVDAAHPDLNANVVNQYNAFIKRDGVVRGQGNQPVGEEFLGRGDGHGTHIAGTIAAACDDVGIQGIACKASMDVYDLGTYGNFDDYPRDAWKDISEEAQFLAGFANAMRHVAKRGDSKIVTGSFNLEAPAIRTAPGGPLQGKAIDEIMETIEKDGVNGFEDLATKNYVTFSNPEDIKLLNQLERTVDEADMLPLGVLIQKSKEWADIESAIADYQVGGGVYIVTESNSLLKNRSSVFNAMPSLSTVVDEDLWISIVMVDRKDVDKGDYSTPINTCGKMAANYCLITPSYFVLSTMTDRVAEWGDSPIFLVDGRKHQVFAGHSMGAPMVAAGLALMEEYNRKTGSKYTMKDLVRMMKEAGNKNFPGFDPELHGRGMLDIGAALKRMGAPLPNSSKYRSYTCEGDKVYKILVEFIEVEEQPALNIIFENEVLTLEPITGGAGQKYAKDHIGFEISGDTAVLTFEPHRELNCQINQ